MVTASVMRRPAENSDLMPSRCSMVAIWGPPPCPTTGLIAVCSKSTISRANALARSSAPMAWPPYLMTMVSSSYCCICGSASDRMRAWSSGLICCESVMKRLSSFPVLAGFYLIGGQGAKCHLPLVHSSEMPGVPRMLRSAPLLRRGALLIRGPSRGEDGSRLCGAAQGRCTASGTRETGRASASHRPCRGHGQHQPARDEQCTAGRRGQRKQAVAGILAQGQIAGEQGGGDDEAVGGRNPDPGVDDA